MPLKNLCNNLLQLDSPAIVHDFLRRMVLLRRKNIWGLVATLDFDASLLSASLYCGPSTWEALLQLSQCTGIRRLFLVFRIHMKVDHIVGPSSGRNSRPNALHVDRILSILRQAKFGMKYLEEVNLKLEFSWTDSTGRRGVDTWWNRDTWGPQYDECQRLAASLKNVLKGWEGDPAAFKALN